MPARRATEGPAWAASGPAWAADTLRVLAALEPAHEMFVRAYVTGTSAAEALRQATGRTTRLDRRAAHRLKARPDVAAAVYRCLTDPAYDAWMRRRIAAGASAPGRGGDTRRVGRARGARP